MVAPWRPISRPRSSPLIVGRLAGADVRFDAHQIDDRLDELAELLGAGREVGLHALVRRAQARLDARLALAAAEETALAALLDDEILDVGRVDVGHDLAQLLERRVLGLLDGGPAGDGGELGLFFLFVERLEVVRLFHRSCSLVG